MAGGAWMTHAGAAFEQARESGKPLFMYWGATWCPPCNRTKALVFQRPDFNALATTAFVPLHIDGDADGAQALADRYHLRSYPTLVIYRPDGTEVTRLPCEVDGERFMALLRHALAAPSTSAQLLEAALAATRALSGDEWAQLAWYSWDTDEGSLLKGRDAGATLGALAAACPHGPAQVRLALLSVVHGDKSQPAHALSLLTALLQDRDAIRTQRDLLLNQSTDLLRALAAEGTPARTTLATALAGVLESLEADLSLSVADRLQALRTRIRLSLLGGPAQRLQELARSRAETARLTVSEPALRHAAINSAAGVLSESGLLDEAQDLLAAELQRSHAPYYFMHNLAAVAKRRGDTAAMLDWYERAWQQAAGPATRLQWGATFLLALLDTMPGDAERIGRAAEGIFAHAASIPAVNAGRNCTQLKRIAERLGALQSDDPRIFALLDAIRRAG